MNSSLNLTNLILAGLEGSELKHAITSQPHTDLDSPKLVTAPMKPVYEGWIPFLEVEESNGILSFSIRGLLFMGNAATVRNRLAITLRSVLSGNGGEDKVIAGMSNLRLNVAQNTAHQFAHSAPGFDEAVWVALEDGNRMNDRLTRVYRDSFDGEIGIYLPIMAAGISANSITVACDHLMDHYIEVLNTVKVVQCFILPATQPSFRRALQVPGAGESRPPAESTRDDEASDMAI